MADEKLKLQIVTSDRSFYDDYIDRVIFKTTEGDIGVLYDHIPITTPLVSGIATIVKDGESKTAVLHGGFAEITEEKVTILSDAAEWPEEINVERAKEAKKRAEKRLNQSQERDAAEARIKAALSRALVRIEAYDYHNNTND